MWSCAPRSHPTTASVITRLGAQPVFIDAKPDTWAVDPELVVAELRDAARRGHRPAAVVTADLYGQCAEHESIVAAAREFDIPVIEDASEARGATYQGPPAGTLGDVGVFTFAHEQIITASGGGMVLTREPSQTTRVRELTASVVPRDDDQAQLAAGFDEGMSDLLASIGRAQLQGLHAKVARRREIYARYHARLASLPGVTFQAEAPVGRSTRWLTCLTIDPVEAGRGRNEVAARLEEANIESRRVRQPVHLQPPTAGVGVWGAR